MFKIIDPNDPEHFEQLSQMHHLRHRVFIKDLKWRVGLRDCSQMEFDEFDHPFCRYLVRLNDNNKVDACTRLTPTCYPYLLSDAFSEYVTDGTTPKDSNIIETSRFCADNSSAPSNVAGLIMAAMLELGVKLGISRYVSLSDARIKPVVRRFGWSADELGPRYNNNGIICVALSYDVTDEYHKRVKSSVGITGDLIQNNLNLHAPVFNTAHAFPNITATNSVSQAAELVH